MRTLRAHYEGQNSKGSIWDRATEAGKLVKVLPLLVDAEINNDTIKYLFLDLFDTFLGIITVYKVEQYMIVALLCATLSNTLNTKYHMKM